MRQTGTGRHLILYDGLCGLCNGLVRFIIWRDHDCIFRFASLQSDRARQMFLKNQIASNDGDTMYVIRNYGPAESVVLARAEAGLFIASHLGWPWRWLVVIRVFPQSCLDSAYDIIAKHRYRWFGKYPTCPLPPERDKWRFLDP